MSQKTLSAVLLAAGLVILTVSVYRDLGSGRSFSSDLRNRVVGARLIHDGKLPYFYKWKNEDGVRYYDPQNFNLLKVSNITATPLFHQLLGPLAELPQWKIDWWWYGFQYLMLAGLVLMAVSLAETTGGKWMAPVFALSFLFTDAWELSIQDGQNYLCIPFLTMSISFILIKRKGIFWAAVAGTASIVLVLIRPNALIFFIPLLFLAKNFTRSWLIAFFIPVIIVAGWTVGDKWERSLWQDYRTAIGEQIRFHQKLNPVMQKNEPFPDLSEWEGISCDEDNGYNRNRFAKVFPENSNFFYLVNLVFHWKMSVRVLLLLSLVIIFSLTGLYYYQNRPPGHFDPRKTVLFGFGLYMISDMFSPIFRLEYYTVQILFLLLLVGCLRRPPPKWIYGLLFTGIFLCIGHLPFMKMQHSIGEYLIITVIILFSLNKEPETRKSETREPKTIE